MRQRRGRLGPMTENRAMSSNPVDITAPEMPSLAKNDQNLVWIDCEMSGLDPEKERLLEIAVVITGPQLTPRIEGPVIVIHQSGRQTRSSVDVRVYSPASSSRLMKCLSGQIVSSTCAP